MRYLTPPWLHKEAITIIIIIIITIHLHNQFRNIKFDKSTGQMDASLIVVVRTKQRFCHIF